MADRFQQALELYADRLNYPLKVAKQGFKRTRDDKEFEKDELLRLINATKWAHEPASKVAYLGSMGYEPLIRALQGKDVSQQGPLQKELSKSFSQEDLKQMHDKPYTEILKNVPSTVLTAMGLSAPVAKAAGLQRGAEAVLGGKAGAGSLAEGLMVKAPGFIRGAENPLINMGGQIVSQYAPRGVIHGLAQSRPGKEIQDSIAAGIFASIMGLGVYAIFNPNFKQAIKGNIKYQEIPLVEGKDSPVGKTYRTALEGETPSVTIKPKNPLVVSPFDQAGTVKSLYGKKATGQIQDLVKAIDDDSLYQQMLTLEPEKAQALNKQFYSMIDRGIEQEAVKRGFDSIAYVSGIERNIGGQKITTPVVGWKILDPKAVGQVVTPGQTPLISAPGVTKTAPLESVLDIVRNWGIDPKSGLRSMYQGGVDMQPGITDKKQQIFSDLIKNSNIVQMSPKEAGQAVYGTNGKFKGEDISRALPNIMLREDMTLKDFRGSKIKIPAGEGLTPYTIKGSNQILLRDGDTFVLQESKFKDLLTNADTAVPKPFEGDVLKKYDFIQKSKTKEYQKTTFNRGRKAKPPENLEVIKIGDLVEKDGNSLKVKSEAFSAIPSEVEDSILSGYYGEDMYLTFLKTEDGYEYFPLGRKTDWKFSDHSYRDETKEDFLKRINEKWPQKSDVIDFNVEYGAPSYSIERPWADRSTYSEMLVYDSPPRKLLKELPEGVVIKEFGSLTTSELNRVKRDMSRRMEEDIRSLTMEKDIDRNTKKGEKVYIAINKHGYPLEVDSDPKKLKVTVLNNFNKEIEQGYIEGHFADLNRDIFKKYKKEQISHGRTQEINIKKDGEDLRGLMIDENQSTRVGQERKGTRPYLLPRPEDDYDTWEIQMLKQMEEAVDRNLDYIVLTNDKIQTKRNHVSQHIREISWAPAKEETPMPIKYNGKNITLSELKNLEGKEIEIPENIIYKESGEDLTRRCLYMGEGDLNLPTSDNFEFKVLDLQKYTDYFKRNFPGRRKIIVPQDYENNLDEEVIKEMRRLYVKRLKDLRTYSDLRVKKFEEMLKNKESIIKEIYLRGDSEFGYVNDYYYNALDKKFGFRLGTVSSLKYDTDAYIKRLYFPKTAPSERGYDYDKLITVETTEGRKIHIYVDKGEIVDLHPSSDVVGNQIIGRRLEDYLNDEGLSLEIARKPKGDLYGKELDRNSTWTQKFYGKDGRDEQGFKKFAQVKELERLKFPVGEWDAWEDLKKYKHYYSSDDLVKAPGNHGLTQTSSRQDFLEAYEEFVSGSNINIEGPEDLDIGDIITLQRNEFDRGTPFVIVEKEGDTYKMLDLLILNTELDKKTHGKLTRYIRDDNIFKMSDDELSKFDLSKRKINKILFDAEVNNYTKEAYFDEPVEKFAAVRLTDRVKSIIKGKAIEIKTSGKLLDPDFQPPKEQPSKHLEALKSRQVFPSQGSQGWANVNTRLAAEHIEKLLKTGIISQGPSTRYQIIEELKNTGMVGKDVNIGQIISRLAKF